MSLFLKHPIILKKRLKIFRTTNFHMELAASSTPSPPQMIWLCCSITLWKICKCKCRVPDKENRVKEKGFSFLISFSNRKVSRKKCKKACKMEKEKTANKEKETKIPVKIKEKAKKEVKVVKAVKVTEIKGKAVAGKMEKMAKTALKAINLVIQKK